MNTRFLGKSSLVFLVVGALVLGGSLPVRIAAAPGVNITITVDTTLDSNAPAYQQCTTAAGDCSLRGAISRANGDIANSYTISLPAGTYLLTLPGSGEDSNATGDLDILAGLTIDGAIPAAATIIDANNIDRALHVHGPAVVWINHVRIMNGRLPDGLAGFPGTQGGSGGGILNVGALKLEDCIIRDNRAGNGGAGIPSPAPGAPGGLGGQGGDGGGIFNPGNLTLKDTIVRDNHSGDGGAGGAGGFVPGGTGLPGGSGGNGGSGGGIDNSGTLVLVNSLVSGNTTGRGGIGGTGGPPNLMGAPAGPGGAGGAGGVGGGIFNLLNLTVVDGTIDGNVTGPGGMGGTGGSSAGVGLGMTGGFGGAGGAGGGLYNNATVVVDNVTISNNTTGLGGTGGTGGNGAVPPPFPAGPGGQGGAGGQGGGTYNNGTLGANNLTISGNITGLGGAGGKGGDDSLASGMPGGPGGNGTSGGDGGGVYNTASATLNNATIADNTAGSGGAPGLGGLPAGAPGVPGGAGTGGGILVSAGTVTLMNTLLGDNTAALGPDCSGALSSQGYNLIESLANCAIAGNLAGFITGLDPMLDVLGNYGGPTETQALKAGSPAIEAGNPAVPGSGGSACMAVDQRGILRPQITLCDIGAFEYFSPTLSGNAGLSGVSITYTGGSTTTDGSGNYSFTVSYGWSGSVTPSKTGYTFSPDHRDYTSVSADQTAQDYSATLNTHTISGNAGLSGVSITYTGGSTTTDGSGNYSFTVSYGWSGSVTPSKTGYIFSPDHRDYTSVSADQTAQDYTPLRLIHLPLVIR